MTEATWIWRYHLHGHGPLNALTARTNFEGVLIRTGDGYGCIHPWVELGDPPLVRCLEDLAGPRRWPVVRRALRCANLDAAARRHQVSLFEDLEVPVSHATLPALASDALTQAVEAGFDRVKTKAGRDLPAEARSLREMTIAFPRLRWRIDFNERPEARDVAEFLDTLDPETRDRIDFLEDPCPYAESTWTELHRQYRVRLAVDREAAPRCGAAQVMVIKPAVDEPLLLGEAAAAAGQEIVVTSSMDHPLGQAFAAWEAARLDLSLPGRIGVCGLQTHHLFAADPFSEFLGPWSPQFQPPAGTGLGFDDLLERLPWRKLG